MNAADILAKLIDGDCVVGKLLESKTGQKFIKIDEDHFLYYPGDGACYEVKINSSSPPANPSLS